MKILGMGLVTTLLLAGCATNQDAINKLDAKMTVLDARLYGIEKDLADVHDYLNQKHDADIRSAQKRNERAKKMQEQLDRHETHIKNLITSLPAR